MIVVIGDLMLDEFWYGSVSRKSPESDNISILKVDTTVNKLGGAANVALNLKKLNNEVMLFGILGLDRFSLVVSSLLDQHKIRRNIVFDKSAETIRKIRVYNNNIYINRIDIEDKLPNREEQILEALKQYDIKCVVLSDYSKGTIRQPKQFIEYFTNKNILVFVDPKKDLNHYKGCFVLKPNLQEFLDWSKLSKKDTIESFVRDNYYKLLNIRESLKVDNLIITAGEEGCLLVNDSVKTYKTKQIKAIDAIGAGDSFLSGLVSNYNITNNINTAVEFANTVAGLSVQKEGTSYVEYSEI